MASSALVSGGSAIGAAAASLTQQALGSNLIRVGTVLAAAQGAAATQVYVPDFSASSQVFLSIAALPATASIPAAGIAAPTVVLTPGVGFSVVGSTVGAPAVSYTYIVVG
jgi:hypothetical protein